MAATSCCPTAHSQLATVLARVVARKVCSGGPPTALGATTPLQVHPDRQRRRAGTPTVEASPAALAPTTA
jgi:hypothetical protein